MRKSNGKPVQRSRRAERAQRWNRCEREQSLSGPKRHQALGSGTTGEDVCLTAALPPKSSVLQRNFWHETVESMLRVLERDDAILSGYCGQRSIQRQETKIWFDSIRYLFYMTMWVQGQRKPDKSKKVTLSSPRFLPWQELFHLRITAAYSAIGTRDATAENESRLKILTSTYFYVEHSNPKFGEYVVAFEHQVSIGLDEAAVSPFDTGGLLQNHVATKRLLSDSTKRSIVRDWSFDVASSETAFSEWVNQEFSGMTEYRHGEVVPGHHLVDAIDLSDPRRSAAWWIWEARLTKSPRTDHLVQPERVYMRPEKLELYLKWLNNTGLMKSSVDRTAHFAWIRDHVKSASEPVSAMLKHLDTRF